MDVRQEYVLGHALTVPMTAGLVCPHWGWCCETARGPGTTARCVWVSIRSTPPLDTASSFVAQNASGRSHGDHDLGASRLACWGLFWAEQIRPGSRPLADGGTSSVDSARCAVVMLADRV